MSQAHSDIAEMRVDLQHSNGVTVVMTCEMWSRTTDGQGTRHVP